MRRLRRSLRRLAGVFAGAGRERDLAEEIAAHIAMQTDDNLRAGMPPAQARREALLKFGSVDSAKESYRDQRGLPWLEVLRQDARYALRSMRRNPGFTAMGAGSLALGIAGATAIFSVVNSTLLRPLPYADPGRLVTVSEGGAITAPLYERFSREARSIEQAAIYVDTSLNLAGHGEPERVPAARVSASLFPLLGVQPRLGRTFTAAEDQPGAAPVVVIGDRLWKRRFGGDPHVLGRRILVNGVPQTIIGIMPPGFQFPYGPELTAWAGVVPPAQMWRPMAFAEDERTCDGCWNFMMLARLRPGIPPAQVRRELQRIAREPGAESAWNVRFLKDAVSGQARRPLAILFGAVAVSLLIACVNVANLLIARSLRRQSEIALRVSVGAGRARVVGQLLTESLVLALASALIALPLAGMAIRVLIATAPASVPGVAQATLDGSALAFALGLGLLTTLLFGALPAWSAARRDPVEALRYAGRALVGKRSALRPALIVAEFALSLVLVVAASLLAKSFVTVARVSLGFHPENVLTMRLWLPDPQYNDKQRANFADQLISRCKALPGVVSAAIIDTLPLTGEAGGWGIEPDDNDSRHVDFRARAATPDYFRTMGIRLVSGRAFTADDRGPRRVTILSQSGARLRWPGIADPLGRKVGPMTLVGIVDDTRASGMDVNTRPYIYVPFAQYPGWEMDLAVRTAADPARLIGPVKSEVWRLDRNEPITHVALMRELVADSIAPRRFPAALMAVFAAFALLLASIGIYGVVAYSVAQRTREIGIRIALGASPGAILRGVLGRAALLAIAGAALGLAAALLLTPLLRSLLFGVGTEEPSVLLASAVLLLAVAAGAGLFPALRAARVDPAVCLRYE